MHNPPNTPAETRRWSTRALLVDDDVPIRDLLCNYLARFNIEAVGVADGQAMRETLAAEPFDVVVLDLMLPGEDGLSLCRWLRSESDIPILMLTARCEPTDRIIGLELGADDYMAKPFEPRELVARIQTVLRRVRDDREGLRADQRASIRFDAWRLNGVLRQLHSPRAGGATVQRRIPPALGVPRTPAPGAQPRTAAGCRPGSFHRGLRPQHRPAGLAPAAEARG